MGMRMTGLTILGRNGYVAVSHLLIMGAIALLLSATDWHT